MTLTTFERWVAILAFAEAIALVFFALGALALWVLYRYPARTPYPESTFNSAGGLAERELQRARSRLALHAATGLVLLLAVVALAFAFTHRIPFHPLWCVKWLMLLPLPFLFWIYLWRFLLALRRYLALRREWHAKLAVGGVLKAFALSGHQVFHDVDVAGLAVDHVVAGPKGVFLINVAVRAKPKVVKDAVVKILPVERQLDFGYLREFEAVFGATRRVTEMSRVLEKLLGHKVRPISAIVVPGWETAPAEDGDHILFSLSSLASLLSWAKPQHGLLTEDLPAINKHLTQLARDPRPV
jgi:hypothetical protein